MPQSTNKARPEVDHDGALRLATEALEHARRHGSPPLPHAYEVWYAYVSGKDEALRRRVDRELDASRVMDLARIERIYAEHFLQKRLSADITAIGNAAEAGLDDAIEVLRGGLGSGQDAPGALHATRDRLTGIRRLRDARQATHRLIELARAGAAHTETLSTELSRLREQLSGLHAELQRVRDTAHLDYLTQLSNRRHLDETLAQEIARAHTGDVPLSFALGDLDGFKRLNDAHGHAAGDAVLKHVAAIIRRNLKGQDTAARFGGEEFAIILPRTTLANATRVIDGIRRQLDVTDLAPGEGRDPIGPVPASFGVTQLLPGDTVEELMGRADALLYRAKQLGRNRVEADL